MHIPDGSSTDYNGGQGGRKTPRFYSWGWLGNLVPERDWAAKEMKQQFLSRLEKLPDQHHTKGSHRCEICGDPCGSATKIFIDGDTTYSCPSGVAHYITKHNYCPPPEVVLALLPNSRTIQAEDIVDELIAELTTRSGFEDVYENIDDDIREEMRDSWVDIVKNKLRS